MTVIGRVRDGVGAEPDLGDEPWFCYQPEF